jgi:hypothetical protein
VSTIACYEDPVTTTVRLLNSNIKVVKDDGSIASVCVSKEWYDRELFKNRDGQVTVGLAQSEDQKIEVSGRVRRRVGRLRVNVWATDRPATPDSGRLMRQKIVDEINRVVRQNNKIPNQTIYDFAGLGYPSGDSHKAFQAAATAELAPTDSGWAELSSADYQKIWCQDSTDYSKDTSINLQYALMLFRFKVANRKETTQKIVLSFVGYGTAPGGNGSTIKVWNASGSAWQDAQSGTGGADETVTITLTSNLTNYIDVNDYVWLLARTTNPSNGTTAATINCDYASCAVNVNGITYLDIVNFRDADKVDVKPFIFRTEFVLRSWSFEDVGGVL